MNNHIGIQKRIDAQGVDVLIILGVRWDVRILEAIASSPIGTAFQLTKREGGGHDGANVSFRVLKNVPLP
jgi:hypothetical protein